MPSLRRSVIAATHCAKIIGLPDLARSVLPDPTKLLEVDLDLDKRRLALAQAVWTAGRPLTWNPLQMARAAETAWEAYRESQNMVSPGRLYLESLCNLPCSTTTEQNLLNGSLRF